MGVIFDKILGRLRQSDSAGSGTANKVAKWITAKVLGDSQITDDGTNVGINNASPTAKLDVKGVDATLNNKSAAFRDISGNIIFEVLNSKVASVGVFGGGNGSYPGFAYGKSKILAINLGANPDHDIEIFSDDTTSDTHFGSRSSYRFWVFGQGQVYYYDADNFYHQFNRAIVAQNQENSGDTGGAGDFRNISTVGKQYGVKGVATGASTTNVGGYFAASGAADNFALETNGKIKSVALPTYADNAAALLGGLVVDDEYKTATGERRIVV